MTISADNASVSFDIYILKSKVYKGVSKAQAICKTKPRYSQAKRMQKGYVDCSSFVWKSYKPYGVNLEVRAMHQQLQILLNGVEKEEIIKTFYI